MGKERASRRAKIRQRPSEHAAESPSEPAKPVARARTEFKESLQPVDEIRVYVEQDGTQAKIFLKHSFNMARLSHVQIEANGIKHETCDAHDCTLSLNDTTTGKDPIPSHQKIQLTLGSKWRNYLVPKLLLSLYYRKMAIRVAIVLKIDKGRNMKSGDCTFTWHRGWKWSERKLQVLGSDQALRSSGTAAGGQPNKEG